MSSQIDRERVQIPLMPASRKRGLSIFMVFGTAFWFVLFTAALVVMQLAPPKPDIWRNLGVAAIGLVGSGLFGWCAIAIRRTNAYLEGTRLYYSSGFWSRYRQADLARVTEARVVEDKRDEGYDLRLRGDGDLKEFPIAHPYIGVIPELSLQTLAIALEANPNKSVMANVIYTLRTGNLEAPEDSSQS